MKLLFLVALVVTAFSPVAAQKALDVVIYETERAFEKAVAEKGINAGFIQYLAPHSVMFAPDLIDGRELWRKRPTSPASLTWNPVRIEVASNGALAYSIGNSVYKPKGPKDTAEYHGHYLSVWARQPDGSYLAVLDAGIDHTKPDTNDPVWTPSATRSASEGNRDNVSARDWLIQFLGFAEKRGLAWAYKNYAHDDIFLMREGRVPYRGKAAAISSVEGKSRIRFAKRRTFVEAADLAYVYSTYTRLDRSNVEIARGNFIQVWKFRNGQWKIVADVFLDLPKPKTS